MAEDRRADPDALLGRLHDEDRGRLTVFLGAAAGVGKTYAMLEAAQEHLAGGLDAVAAWVDTHGRSDTEALLAQIPSLPPASREYRGRDFRELDLDAVLARRPRLALVDELAHTNIPGSRHHKRYQDVDEILQAGIDVYTTLNVQHLESFNDVVERITGVAMRETVPDSVLDGATVHLVDIPPDELIRRLEEGKVYVPHQAERALRKFFRPGNLNALRELALRYTAQRVDKELGQYMREHSIPGPWPATERLLVCVSPSPFSTQLVRTTARMARALNAEWIAAHVDSPGWLVPGGAARQRLSDNLHLADQLGARTVVLTGGDVAGELLRLAREQNVTQIIIGKPVHSGLRGLVRGSVVDRVIRGSKGMSVHVIPGLRARAPGRGGPMPALKRERALHYVGAILSIAAVTALLRALQAHLDLATITVLYMSVIVFGASRWGLGASLTAATAAALSVDFFFVPPFLTLTVRDVRHVGTLIVFAGAAALVSGLAVRARLRLEVAREREARTAALYAVTREIAGVSDPGRVLSVVARRAAECVGGRATVLLPGEGGQLCQHASEPDGGDALPDKEKAVATWAFQHGQVAGRGTDTLSGAGMLFVPLRAEGRVLGVLGVGPWPPRHHLSREQGQMLEALAALAGIVMAHLSSPGG